MPSTVSGQGNSNEPNKVSALTELTFWLEERHHLQGDPGPRSGGHNGHEAKESGTRDSKGDGARGRELQRTLD